MAIRCGGEWREPTRVLDSRLVPDDARSTESMRQNPATTSNCGGSTSFSEFPRHQSFLHPAPSLIGCGRGPFGVPGKLDVPSFRRDISDGQTRRTFKMGNAGFFHLSSTHRKNLCKRTSQRFPRLGSGCCANRITSQCSAPDTRRRGFGSHLRHGKGGRRGFCCRGGFPRCWCCAIALRYRFRFPLCRASRLVHERLELFGTLRDQASRHSHNHIVLSPAGTLSTSVGRNASTP